MLYLILNGIAGLIIGHAIQQLVENIILKQHKVFPVVNQTVHAVVVEVGVFVRFIGIELVSAGFETFLESLDFLSFAVFPPSG